jgi:hypothetical protein
VETWSRGSIGFTGEVFEVMTQVDLGLTSVGRSDSADSVISVNDVNILKFLILYNRSKMYKYASAWNVYMNWLWKDKL